MKYKIYEMVRPEHLQLTVPDGYYIKTLERIILEVPSGLEYEYGSIEEATADIVENREQLKSTELCILPIVSIDYEGNVT